LEHPNLYWLIHTLIKTLIILNILAFIFIERLVLLRFIYWYLNWSQNISFLLRWFLVFGMLFFPVFDLMLNSLLNTSPDVFHYKISQFSRRTYSIVVWLKIFRWFIYRRITSVGFTFFGDSPFRPISVGKIKKTFADGFIDEICAPKKKIQLEICREFFIPSVIFWFTNGYVPLVNLLVSVWNTHRIYPSVNSLVNMVATVKCRWINSVGKVFGECYCQIPTD
jgi:hypothetical protein